jgi:hypothetical protein
MIQSSVPVSSAVHVQTGYEPRGSFPVLRTCPFFNSSAEQKLCPKKGVEMGDTLNLAAQARDSAEPSGDTGEPEVVERRHRGANGSELFQRFT